MATPDRQTQGTVVKPSVFASADTPADEARRWLTNRFDEQAARGEPDALTPEQRLELAQLLSSAWWRAVFEDERSAETPAGAHSTPAAERTSAHTCSDDSSSDDNSDAGGADAGGADAGWAAAALLRRALPPAVRAASRLPGGGLILALYLRNLANEAWAMAWNHELLSVAIAASCDAARSSAGDGADDLDRLGWALLRFMEREFRVETALLTGRLETVAALAQVAVAEVEPIVAAVEELAPSVARDALLREASNEATYYRAVRDTAGVGKRLFSGDRSNADAELERVRASVDAASFNAMDASELRGHLAGIAALHAARGRDWLHVDEGRVRIIYPFGIRTTGQDDPISVVATLRRQALALHAQGGTLGGLPVTDVRGRLELSDVWQGTDDLGRGYRGVTILLGDLSLEHPGAEAPLEVVQTRVQLSHLGNHTIVFEIALRDVPAHRVAQAIHLATPVFGDLREIADVLRMRTTSGSTVSGLPEVVGALLAEIRGLLDATGDAIDGSQLAAREGSFGVMATIVAASRQGPDGRAQLAHANELLELWGIQPLLHPLPSGAASAADWALYDLDSVRTWSLLHLNNELLASNSNVTLLASFGSPDYAVREVESYIEFAHSLHGMYQGWQDTIRTHVEIVSRLLRAAVAVVPRPATGASPDDADNRGRRAAAIAELDDLVSDIERAELELQAFIQSCDAIMLFIDSPGIVTSPPLRTDLDTILDSNGYPRLRDGFTHAVRDVLGTRLQPLLEVVHGRMAQAYAAESARLERDRLDAETEANERTDRLFDVLGIVFTVIGFSGLASVLQAGHPDWDGGVAWWLVVAILVLAAVSGVLLSFLPGLRARHPRTRERSAP